MAIIHDSDNSQFTLKLQGLESVLQYRLLGADRVDFNHTFVPPELRGHGHAARLVDAGFAWARAQNRKIEASCWYAAQRLEKELN